MSPILVRPVREQLEHDRLIRHLQTKYSKKKAEVGINVGDDRVASVKIGSSIFYPDIVVSDGRKVTCLVEVETGESVNNLEVLAEWVHFSRSRVPFHLYVPVHGYDAARRLCDAHHARVNEIWTYRPEVEGFDLIRMYVDAAAEARIREAAAARPAKAKTSKARPEGRKTAAGTAKKPAAPRAKKAAGTAARGKAAARTTRAASKAATRTKAAKRPAKSAVRPAAAPARTTKKKPAGPAKKGSAGRRR